MKVLILLMGCVVVLPNLVLSGQDIPDPPLIPCKTDKDCETICKANKNQQDRCMKLTICDDGLRFAYWKKEGKKKKPVDKQTGSPANKEKDIVEGGWPDWPDQLAGVCKSDKKCTKDSDCMRMEHNSESIDGVHMQHYVKLKCRDAKCHWDQRWMARGWQNGPGLCQNCP